jgi:hypothetical protein
MLRSTRQPHIGKRLFVSTSLILELGVFAAKTIRSGQKVEEYVGEKVGAEVANCRGKEYSRGVLDTSFHSFRTIYNRCHEKGNIASGFTEKFLLELIYDIYFQAVDKLFV